MGTTPRDPEEATAAGAPAHARIPAATRVGTVHLTVSDLDRSVAYYENAIGLSVRERAGGALVRDPFENPIVLSA